MKDGQKNSRRQIKAMSFRNKNPASSKDLRNASGFTDFLSETVSVEGWLSRICYYGKETGKKAEVHQITQKVDSAAITSRMINLRRTEFQIMKTFCWWT